MFKRWCERGNCLGNNPILGLNSEKKTVYLKYNFPI